MRGAGIPWWMRAKGRHLRLVLCGALVLGGVAAGSAQEAPTVTSAPTATPVVAAEVGSSASHTAADATPSPTPRPMSTPRPTERPTPTPTPTPQPNPAQAHLVGSLADQIDPLVAAVPAEVGVIVALPDGTRLYEHQPDRLFEAASLYKLGIMVELYRQREAGHLTFDEALTIYPGFFAEGPDHYGFGDIGATFTIDELMWSMIAVSSNVASYALLDRVGNERVNATMAGLGLTQTEIRWNPDLFLPGTPEPDPAPEPTPPGDEPSPTPEPSPEAEPTGPERAATTASTPRGQAPLAPRLLAPAPGPLPAPPLADAATAYNVTTPADMARLFALLLDGQVVSPQASREMLDLLAQQGITDRLPVGLPPGTRVAHKTGNLPGIVHDAGVIYAPAGPVIVAVLSEDAHSEWAVVELARAVAAIAYDSRS